MEFLVALRGSWIKCIKGARQLVLLGEIAYKFHVLVSIHID